MDTSAVTLQIVSEIIFLEIFLSVVIFICLISARYFRIDSSPSPMLGIVYYIHTFLKLVVCNLF